VKIDDVSEFDFDRSACPCNSAETRESAMVLVEITVPASLSYTGEARRATRGIDPCIAQIVQALNAGGVATVASCCGHGRGAGSIVLADGRELVISRFRPHEPWRS